MTLHTNSAAAANTAKPTLANTRAFWSLVAAIVTATIMLTGWTAAQASAVNDVTNGNGPEHPSVRQLERQAQVVDDPQHYSVRQLERVAQQDEVDRPQPPSIRQAERAQQVRANEVARMEYNELRRFRNRAPATALAALDAAIAQLQTSIA